MIIFFCTFKNKNESLQRWKNTVTNLVGVHCQGTQCVCVCDGAIMVQPSANISHQKIAIIDGLTTIKYASVNSRSRGISKASTFHEGIIVHPLFPGHLPVFSMRYVAAMRFGLYRPVVSRGGGDGSGDVGLQ